MMLISETNAVFRREAVTQFSFSLQKEALN